jgi:hypothetical protein
MLQTPKECQDTAGMFLSFLKDDLEVKVGQLEHFLQVWSGLEWADQSVFDITMREEH